MGHAQLMELEFESNLCTELSERGWLYEADGNTAVAGWDVALALVPQDCHIFAGTVGSNSTPTSTRKPCLRTLRTRRARLRKRNCSST